MALIKREEIRTYQLGKYQAQVDRFKSDPKIKGLREEVAILRMLLEQIMNKCEDTHDILIASSKIAQLIAQIKDTVVSTARLEASLGETMDKIQAVQLAEAIIAVLCKYVEDADVLEMISNDIGELIEKAGVV